jgi:hypothetical protein
LSAPCVERARLDRPRHEPLARRAFIRPALQAHDCLRGQFQHALAVSCFEWSCLFVVQPVAANREQAVRQIKITDTQTACLALTQREHLGQPEDAINCITVSMRFKDHIQAAQFVRVSVWIAVTCCNSEPRQPLWCAICTHLWHICADQFQHRSDQRHLFRTRAQSRIGERYGLNEPTRSQGCSRCLSQLSLSAVACEQSENRSAHR